MSIMIEKLNNDGNFEHNSRRPIENSVVRLLMVVDCFSSHA